MRAALIAFACSTALTASTVALVDAPAEGRAITTTAAPTQHATLSITPGISQNSGRVASANNAWVAGGAKFSPAKNGRLVTVQRRLSPVSSWTNVKRGRENAGGIFRFVADGASGSTPYEYRVVAARTSGLPRVVTNVTSSAEWNLKFDDGFSGTTLDASKWSHRNVGIRTGSRLRAQSSANAVQVTGGAVQLQVKRNPNRKGYYLNGHIGTQNRFAMTYGVTAARIKFEKGRGQHGGFWMQPQSTTATYGSPSRTGAEIDVAEFFGKGYPDGGLAHFLYSYPRRGVIKKYGDVFPKASTALRGRSDTWWSHYHVFSVAWTPSGYVFRIDGKETWRSSKAISKRPQYLILSLLTSDWELPQLDRSTLPTTMKVDWVRAWQR